MTNKIDHRVKIECEPIREYEVISGVVQFSCDFRVKSYPERRSYGTICTDTMEDAESLSKSISCLPEMIPAFIAYKAHKNDPSAENKARMETLMELVINKLEI